VKILSKPTFNLHEVKFVMPPHCKTGSKTRTGHAYCGGENIHIGGKNLTKNISDYEATYSPAERYIHHS
jgi:hypothetical protein